jgi:UDP-glucose-4-epimerase GalE
MKNQALKKTHILVTGGAGYIGSHTVRKLIGQKYNVIVIDNLSKGHRTAILSPDVTVIIGDINNKNLIETLFSSFSISAVIHFAAFAYVGESVINPASYYANNVAAPLVLLDKMLHHNCKKIVFSSSCATYGNPMYLPIDEKHPQIPISPYGNTKLTFEKILLDYGQAYGLQSVILRYFNACGAAEDGLIGEDHDPETHLIPLVLKTALGELDYVRVFGNDYTTPDGTCIRDYIHVNDLACAHIKALDYLICGGHTAKINLGSGNGISVNEIIGIAEKITGKQIKRRFEPRRPGDPSSLVASTILAKAMLNWEPSFSDIDNVIKTAWFWISGPQKGKCAE